MARDVEADVNINDKSSRGLASFLAGLKRAKNEVKDTQRGIDKASESSSKLGKSVDENAKAFSKLSSELEVSKKELGLLARAFADAGSAAERSDISKAMRKQQTEIRNLTKNRDILKDLLPEDEVQGFGKRIVSEVSKAFSAVSESGGPALAAVAAAAAPAIGASISGAIIGGAGLGGIVGGVILAAQDQRVQTALGGLKTHILNELKDAATPFVATTLNGITQIEHAVDSIHFKQIFADSDKNVAPVIDGVTTAVEELGGAVEKLVHNSGPAVAAIGKEVGAFGKTVGDGLGSLADNSKEGADALTNLFTIINLGVGFTFALVNGLTEIYGTLRKISGGGLIDSFRAIGDAHASVAEKTRSMAEAYVQTTTSIDQFGQAILTNGDAIATYSQQIEGLASAGHALFDSTTQVGAAIDNVTSAAKKNGKTLDENTAKGRANRDALSSLASALVAQYNGYVAVNGEGSNASKVAQDNRNKFIRLATALTGSSSKAADLATKLGLIPPKKEPKVGVNGYKDAAARLEALKEKTNALHDKTVTIRYRTVSDGRERVDASGHRIGGYNAVNALRYFDVAQPGDGIRRSGGASPVQVDNTTNVTVLLDGREIRATARAEANAAVDRASHRQRVGKR